MPAPAPQRFVLGSYGQNIVAEIVERNDSTGADEVVNIATATSLKMLLRTPDNQKLVKTATLVTNGTDGLMKYQVESGLFDKKNRKLLGTWRYRPSFTLGDVVADENFGASHEWSHFIVCE